MNSDPKLLEKEAYALLAQENLEQAFVLFKKAADIYRQDNNHKEAALCFTCAASCWSRKSGEKTFYNAAIAYEQAAKEAELSRDFEYASLLYKYAAVAYEKDIEFSNFSQCFYRSKECYRKFLTLSFINPHKIQPITKTNQQKGIRGLLKRIFTWLALTLSFLVWGHGERPLRTLYSVFFIVFLSAFFYAQGELVRNGIVFKPDFWQALYFSAITFTTVGYGDITPTGFNQLIAVFEPFCGLFIVPLFIIGLARKYLRV